VVRLRPASLAAALAAAPVALASVALAACVVTGAPVVVAGGSVARPVPQGTTDDGCPATRGGLVLEGINRLRAERGLASLRPHPELVRAARRHTEEQRDRDRMSHDGADGSAPADRATAAGYRWSYVAENVASGYPTPDAVVDAWLDSRGHRAVMLAPEPIHAGIGYADRPDGGRYWYWTLVTGAPAPDETTQAADCHP
jgi:uncharacterized protein YkwD